MTYPVEFTEEELAFVADGWRIANDEGDRYAHLFATHVDIEKHNPCKGVNIVGILKDETIESNLAAFSHGRILVYMALGIMASNHPGTDEECDKFDNFVSRVRGE